ncbi:MAG: hypothetical protein HUK03_01235 [Bacteroidaceae bacterium]|nr:hypothetical protein [Bacteroidaceae bacterium]
MAEAKKNRETISCITCIHASLMQWMQNPIIAHCQVRDQREVAEVKRSCKEYKENSEKNPAIQHFSKYEEKEE